MTAELRRRRATWFVSAFLALAGCGGGGGGGGAVPNRTWHVDDDAPPGGAGTSWADALSHPQYAMDVAIPGDEVWLAEGTYVQRAPGETVLLTMKEGVSVYGGFAGTEDSRDQRDPVAHVTVLDGDMDGDTFGDVYHVIVGASDTVIDGLTVTRGRADPSFTPEEDKNGGGLYLQGVDNVSVLDCTFEANFADSDGAGIYADQVTGLLVEGCGFTGNSTRHSDGAGLYADYGSVTVTSCTFTGNSAGGHAGGLWFRGSTANVSHCTFEGNDGSYGAGIYCGRDSTAQVLNCDFIGNIGVQGGGLFCTDCVVTVTECLFDGNSSNSGGGLKLSYPDGGSVTRCTFVDNDGDRGGGAHFSYSTLPVTNCLFSGNKASGGGTSGQGGGVYIDGLSPVITNCTFGGNRASQQGGAACVFWCSPDFVNCILWNSDAPEGPVLHLENAPSTSVTYSAVEGAAVYPGEGNTNEDPRFLSLGSWNDNMTPWTIGDDVWTSGDYHLMASSPCIDTGTSAGAPLQDMEGVPRTPGCDMGAYEYVATGGGSGSPVAEDKAVTTDEDTPVGITLSVSGPSGPLSWVIDEGPYHGTLSGAAPDLTYTPDMDYHGPDCMAYHAVEAAVHGSPAAVDIVVNPVADIWRVDVDAAAGGDGHSWPLALRHPQDASDAAEAGDEIWVAEGTYVRRQPTDTILFSMTLGVDCYGGFDGTEAVRGDRDPGAHLTELDGEDVDGHVVTGCDNSVFDGFTVSRGKGTGSGVYNFQMSPTITDCVFRNNSGKTIYNDWSAPIISGCRFENNPGGDGGCIYNDSGVEAALILDCVFIGNGLVGGGSIYCGYVHPVISGCYFEGNTGDSISCFYSSPDITDCDFVGNGNGSGSALYCRYSSPVVSRCEFMGNSGPSGGAIQCRTSGRPKVFNSLFVGNASTISGGAVHLYNNSDASFANCVFAGNRSNRGGAVNSDRSDPTFANCTFTGNWAEMEGGAVRNVDSNPAAVNCIFWGDVSPVSQEVFNDATSTMTMTYSLVEGGYAGTGNVDDVPSFIDNGSWDDNSTPGDTSDDVWLSGDHHIQAGSACIDAGDNVGVPEDMADLDGDSDTVEPLPLDLDDGDRFVDDPLTTDTGSGSPPVVDMGAYELRP